MYFHSVQLSRDGRMIILPLKGLIMLKLSSAILAMVTEWVSFF